MKCPKCGNEIKDGYLYCDVCGEEIRIVPDFDAVSDENLNIHITDVIDTQDVKDSIKGTRTKEVVKEIASEATKEIDNKTVKKKGKSDNAFLIKALVFAGAICAVILVVFFIINRKLSYYYSVDGQYELAFSQYEDKDYDASVKTLKHALTIDPKDERIRILLADNYFMLSKFDESNAVLYELLGDYPSDPAVYERIINNYKSTGNVLEISKLLNNISDEQIKDEYKEYLVNDVTFSVKSGNYDEEKELVLSSDMGSNIYYTDDGSIPDANSKQYTNPIELPAGEYTISAVAINSSGIKSSVTSESYVIDYFVPDAPVINIKDGTYNTPKVIDVDFADYDTCYYTIDGDDPGMEDEVYYGPIAMYIGKHEYKFCVISAKGVKSEVAKVTISLELVNLVGMDVAKNNLINYKAAKGVTGFTYKCEQACVSDNITYYIINEYSNDAEGKNIKTGNCYAVDCMTGATFRAILNKQTGEYSLTALL